jgi:NOL1/NOP2/fmu family ribosome biogenesis protein
VTDPDRYDRLPATGTDGPDGDDPSRESVLEYFDARFGLEPLTFEHHTFWEKGADSVWVVRGREPDLIDVEALGLRLLRTGGRHWKPTTIGVQRFGTAATRNVIPLDGEAARRFVAGEDQPLAWDGDWGYLIAAFELGGEPTPLGVGLYTHGELASNVPKSRRLELE